MSVVLFFCSVYIFLEMFISWLHRYGGIAYLDRPGEFAVYLMSKSEPDNEKSTEFRVPTVYSPVNVLPI